MGRSIGKCQIWVGNKTNKIQYNTAKKQFSSTIINVRVFFLLNFYNNLMSITNRQTIGNLFELPIFDRLERWRICFAQLYRLLYS